MSGKIIFLNGATSSGKSTTAIALQEKIKEPFWHISIDHLRDSGVLPLKRYKSGEFVWKEDREAFFKGFHLSLRAYVDAGNNLIIEHIIETKEWKNFLVSLLQGVDVFFVAIHCPLDELKRREQARGNRPKGGAEKDFKTIHALNKYDLELDGMLPTDNNVEILLSAWEKREFSAFSL